MTARKMGRQVYNRLTVNQLHAEVEKLRKRNDELEKEARKDREDREQWATSTKKDQDNFIATISNQKSDIERLRTEVDDLERVGMKGVRAYEDVVMESGSVLKDALHATRMLKKEKCKLKRLQKLTNASHKTLIDFSHLILTTLARVEDSGK